jgi:2-phosphoglycerate kinase
VATAPSIILLGGAPGTGKTTLANLLVRQLGLAHHLSTGFIRASIRPLLSESDARLLHQDSYDAWRELPESEVENGPPLLRGVSRQASIIRPSIETCVARAVEEGIGLVIEGTQLVPGALSAHDLDADLFCVLDVSDREALRQRAVSPSHHRRSFSEEQMSSLLRLQEEIVKSARALGVPVVLNDQLDEALAQVQALLSGAGLKACRSARG